jgi:type VI secretion system protein ImpJ
MFLRPHHLQAASAYSRQEMKASEDWYHPFNYGFRSIDLDRDELRDFRVVLRSCEARFKDGTKVSIPADGAPDPIVLTPRMFEREQEVVVLLAVPKLRVGEGRANVESGDASQGQGCRYWVQSVSIEDHNTGSNKQEVEVHRLRCKMLLKGQAQDGYNTHPLVRVILASEDGTPIIDPTFVPPLLIMDGFPPLMSRVRGLHLQISRHINDLLVQLGVQGRLYET